MGKYLITGIAGSGKSTIADELQKKGYYSIDTDSQKNLSQYINKKTGLPIVSHSELKDGWIKTHDWLWNEKKLHEILDTAKQDIYLCGSSGNQEKFYKLFDQIFLLEIDEHTLRERLTPRKKDFGSIPGEIEALIKWFPSFHKRTKAYGVIVIDASLPSNEIINRIISHSDAT